MKILFDFLPLLLFFGAFSYADGHKAWAAAFATAQLGFLVSGGSIGQDEAPVVLATVVVMVATLLQVVIMKALRQKVDAILWVSLVLVMVMGGLTLYFHSKTFIVWKPTLLYWAMALGFWGSQQFWGKNLLKAVLKDVPLPEPVWLRLNWMWVLFFGAMGVLNLYVAYTFSTSTWATFKAFGATGLVLAFTVGQGFYLAKHMPPAEETASKS